MGPGKRLRRLALSLHSKSDPAQPSSSTTALRWPWRPAGMRSQAPRLGITTRTWSY
jgi:hypothetical protein